MNEPTTTKPLYRRLTFKQVIEEIQDRSPNIYVHIPISDDNTPRYLRVATAEHDSIIARLESDPDKDSVESFFYIDNDLDLILDPYTEP